MYRFLECNVGQYMTRDVVIITRDAILQELEGMFATHDSNAFPVVEDGRMVGIVTKFDFLKAFAFTTRQMVPRYDELMSTTAREVMTEAVVDVRPDAPLTRVLQLMVNLKARSFPVIDREGHLAGIISREDIIRALNDSVQQGESST